MTIAEQAKILDKMDYDLKKLKHFLKRNKAKASKDKDFDFTDCFIEADNLTSDIALDLYSTDIPNPNGSEIIGALTNLGEDFRGHLVLEVNDDLENVFEAIAHGEDKVENEN